MSSLLSFPRESAGKTASFPQKPRSCYDRETQSLRCEHCKGFVNLNRRTVENPERTVMLIEAFEEQHKGCEEFENYRRARAEQIWKRGMKLALVN